VAVWCGATWASGAGPAGGRWRMEQPSKEGAGRLGDAGRVRAGGAALAGRRGACTRGPVAAGAAERGAGVGLGLGVACVELGQVVAWRPDAARGKRAGREQGGGVRCWREMAGASAWMRGGRR
jgi:hypothetical protein